MWKVIAIGGEEKEVEVGDVEVGEEVNKEMEEDEEVFVYGEVYEDREVE